MSWIKLLKLNFLVTLGLLITFEFGLAAAFAIKDNYFTDPETTERRSGPNLTRETMGFSKEIKNFRGYPYKAFLGWVSPDFKGDFLNVSNERRNTIVPKELVGDTNLHFFGGSTIWGHGVSDKNTIPSLIADKFKLKAINYGEQAYNSRQELNLLLDNIVRIKKGDVVVFYDGVNDVYHNCRSYNSINGHAREFYMREALAPKENKENLSLKLVKSLSTYRFVKGLANKLFPKKEILTKGYVNSCSDPVYAASVANFLVKNWEAAEAILESKGINFMCILQPNPYTFEGKVAYANHEFKSQVEMVYPLIKMYARNLSCFKDFSLVLKEDNFTDSCCHLNELGNSELSFYFGAEITRKFGISLTK